MAKWWEKVFGKKEPPSEKEHPSAKPTEKAKWLAADDPRNPFGVELLDLMVTQTIVATTSDPANAQRAIAWGTPSEPAFDIGPVLQRPAIDCSIRLPIDRSLPDGLLFTPKSMDEKWAIAWRDGRVIAIRSWTGLVDAVADARIEGSALVIERIRVIEGSAFTLFGTLPHTFDWFLRSHALREKLPFPADADGAAMLENVPLSAFSSFGNFIFCAARVWQPPPPKKPLRSDGRVIRAVREGRVDELTAADDIDAPSTFGGYTALHLGIVRGETRSIQRLLELGADPNLRVDNGNFALGIAIVHDAPPELFDLIEQRVDLFAVNDDGFNALHAACEVGNVWAIRWLIARGHGLEPRTKHGSTPLQIACALGHLDAAKVLVDLGADIHATSPDGTALEIARREGKAEVAAWLENPK